MARGSYHNCSLRSGASWTQKHLVVYISLCRSRSSPLRGSGQTHQTENFIVILLLSYCPTGNQPLLGLLVHYSDSSTIMRFGPLFNTKVHYEDSPILLLLATNEAYHQSCHTRFSDSFGAGMLEKGSAIRARRESEPRRTMRQCDWAREFCLHVLGEALSPNHILIIVSMAYHWCKYMRQMQFSV